MSTRVQLLEDSEQKRILDAIDDEELLGLCKDLIAIPSHAFSPRQETDVAEYLMHRFQQEGIESYLQDVENGRCNVIAKIPGRGGGSSIMLNGHIDTVPAQDMDSAFEPYIKEGRLYGRGTADMKGGVASMAYALMALKRTGLTFAGDIYFSGVVGEEQALSQGTLYVCKHGPHPDAVVVGEPTDLRTVIAHKGFDNYRIDITGIAAHSSKPQNGASAVFAAAAIIRAIEDELIPSAKTIEHPYVGSPTINVAAVVGGAHNDVAFFRGDSWKIPGAIVPDFATIYLDRRRVPGETLEQILKDIRILVARVQERFPGVQAEAVLLEPSDALPTHPPLETEADERIVEHCIQWAGMVAGVRADPVGVPYWSDAAVFKTMYGIPAIVYGPAHIDNAHATTENVPVGDLSATAKVYALLAASMTYREKE